MNDVESFKAKLRDVSLNFTIYSELFDEQDAVDIMNNVNPLIFGNYQRCLVDVLYLEISKLLDPMRQGGNQNLSFAYIISLVPQQYQQELNSDLSVLENLFEQSNLKKYRNKKLAHNDLQSIKSERGIELNISSSKLENMLDCAWLVLGKVEFYLGLTDRPYKTAVHVRLPTGITIEEFISQLGKCTQQITQVDS
ncbi:hypothetical protein [Vibrio kanaloae]|uniref:AbiU2 domain-containing protein n=1 Tax=Vibrio kanaloae TaxID=170673 RepID=UPI0011B55DFB|nr:hypothetical protein [Vibrio kanaloae]